MNEYMQGAGGTRATVSGHIRNARTLYSSRTIYRKTINVLPWQQLCISSIYSMVYSNRPIPTNIVGYSKKQAHGPRNTVAHAVQRTRPRRYVTALYYAKDLKFFA